MPDVIPDPEKLFGTGYWYIPYATTNETQMLAFAKAYEALLREGRQPGDPLKVEAGKGAGGGDKLWQLQEGVEKNYIADINNPGATEPSTSEIPTVIAQPKKDDNGANVLFFDGHVRFLQYGQFPVTHKIIDALSKLDPPESPSSDR